MLPPLPSKASRGQHAAPLHGAASYRGFAAFALDSLPLRRPSLLRSLGKLRKQTKAPPMPNQELITRKLNSAHYKANAALKDLWQALQQVTDQPEKAKIHRTYQVLSLIVDQLYDLTPPFK